MSISVEIEDEETVTIRIEAGYIGLGFDEHGDMEERRGLKLGVASLVELALPRAAADELLLRLCERATI